MIDKFFLYVLNTLKALTMLAIIVVVTFLCIVGYTLFDVVIGW